MKRLSSFGRTMRVLMSTQFGLMSEYRAEVVIWMLSGTMSLIMMLVWMEQAKMASGGQVQGYSSSEFAAYFISIWMTSQFLVVWVAYELDFYIRQGTLSPKLLRPMDPMWQEIASHLAEKSVRFIPMFALIALFAWLSGAQFSGDVWAYLSGALLIVLGFAVRFLWEYCIGLLAFWTESSISFQQGMWLLYAGLGGLFAPLAFFPQWVQNIAVWTPFPYMLGLPAELLSGKADTAQTWQALGVLVTWLVVLWFVRRAVWQAGLKKYGAVGA